MNTLMHFTLLSRRLLAFFYAAVLVLALAAGVAAQSTEAETPTPIGTNEISGVIRPRDVGDPRLTRYFYAFTGTPGDLVVTVESRNLNGDVDLFIANGMRPVAKVGMYAGELSTSTSKSIYLRQRESFILRVEGRSPNDDEGSYRVRFGGSFEPLAVAETPATEPETPTVTTARDKNVRRVTSTGARIEEPVTETATTESSAETAPPAVASETAAAETPSPTEPTPATAEPAKPTPPRTTRTRRGRNTRRERQRPATAGTESAPSTVPGQQPETTPPAQPITANARLIIETRDGMRVERFMSTVRRVTVENGQIIVVRKDGTIERLKMTDVLRMAIEP